MIGEHIDNFEPPETENTGIADRLSPSQVRCYLGCAAQWAFTYHYQLPSPPGSAMAVGSAVHAGLAENFEQKLQSHCDLPVEEVVALTRANWLEERDRTRFRDEEDPRELGEVAAALVRQYMREVAPGIQPLAVEQRLHGVIAGVHVVVRIDLLAVNGRGEEVGTLREIKTSARRPSGVNHMHRFQVATYRRVLVQLERRASNFVHLDTLVKNKAPVIVPESWEVATVDDQMVDTLYPMVQAAARTGIWLPNRASVMCSRRQCPHWRACIAEFGGDVRL